MRKKSLFGHWWGPNLLHQSSAWVIFTCSWPLVMPWVFLPLHICWGKSTFRTFCSPSTPVASTQPSRPSENPSAFARFSDHTTWHDGFFFWGLYFGPLLLWIVYDLLMSICLTLQLYVDRWISKMWKQVIIYSKFLSLQTLDPVLFWLRSCYPLLILPGHH